MKKIPTIFMKNPKNMGLVTEDIDPICQWVFDGEGIARQKFDGTCCMILNNKLYKRRMVKKGKKSPEGFRLADSDENTGKQFGWVEVDYQNPSDKYHVEAWGNHWIDDINKDIPSCGTYELVGPKIQGGVEGSDHVLIAHNTAKSFDIINRTFEGIKEFLKDKDVEGLVFHHDDGRMAKIRKSDFGMKR